MTKRPNHRPRHYPEQAKKTHTIRVTDAVWEWAKAQHPRGLSGYIESLWETSQNPQ